MRKLTNWLNEKLIINNDIAINTNEIIELLDKYEKKGNVQINNGNGFTINDDKIWKLLANKFKNKYFHKTNDDFEHLWDSGYVTGLIRYARGSYDDVDDILLRTRMNGQIYTLGFIVKHIHNSNKLIVSFAKNDLCFFEAIIKHMRNKQIYLVDSRIFCELIKYCYDYDLSSGDDLDVSIMRDIKKYLHA